MPYCAVIHVSLGLRVRWRRSERIHVLLHQGSHDSGVEAPLCTRARQGITPTVLPVRRRSARRRADRNNELRNASMRNTLRVLHATYRHRFLFSISRQRRRAALLPSGVATLSVPKGEENQESGDPLRQEINLMQNRRPSRQVRTWLAVTSPWFSRYSIRVRQNEPKIASTELP